MACLQPLTGWRTPDGKITFKQKDGYHDLPQSVACGQCQSCRLEKSRQWAVRCLHERQMHQSNCFVTLTYDEEHLPPDKSLDLSHWQLFAKRLRKARGPFRFYHCGEYGEKSGRAHLHALLFGLDFTHDQTLYTHTPQGNKLYESPSLHKLWGMGHCQIGSVTFESAAYVARYIMKKQRGEEGQWFYRDLAIALTQNRNYERVDSKTGEVFDGLKPPYTTMSRRPGIGKTWLDKYGSDVFPSDEVIINGARARPPRFYDNQLTEEELLLVKSKRRKAAKKHHANNTRDRLRVREKHQELQLKQLVRDKL